MACRHSPNRKLWGLLQQRPRWGLSFVGKVLLLLLGTCAGFLWLVAVHPFFAVTAKVDSRLLAVEGWVHEYAIAVAADEFGRGAYERVFSTGGPLHGMGGYLYDTTTAANVGARRLKAAGVPESLIQMVPAEMRDRDRTYGTAVALRSWLEINHVPATSINVLTMDVHARRTRLLFQKAFGNQVKIGIISVPNPDYDPSRWWRYSQGVRSVLGECIAYTYAKLFFYPREPRDPAP